MSNHSYNSSGSEPKDGYENEDFSTGAIVGSLVGLAILCIVSFVIVVGMYRYLESTQMEHASSNPMVPMKADTRHMTPGPKLGDLPMEVQAFPKPRLQEDDVKDMREQLFGEESKLQSYAWTDKDSGEARIPVERAMDLIAERGLPMRGEVAAATTAAEPEKKAVKAKAKKK